MQTTKKPLLVLAGLAFVLCWVVPNHYLPWPSFYNEAAAAIAILLATLALSSELRLPSWWPIVGFLATVPLLQFAVGTIIFIGTAAVATTVLLLGGLSIAVGCSVSSSQRQSVADWFAGLLLIAAFVSALAGISQWLMLGVNGIFVSWLPDATRIAANLGQPNNLASLLCLGICGVTYLCCRRLLPLPAASLITVLLSVAIVATMSRTSWIVVPCLMALTIAWRKVLSLHSLALVCVAGLTVLVGTLLWSEINEALLISPGLEERTALPGARLTIWKTALAAIAERPWLGWGWNQAALAHTSTIGGAAQMPPFTYTHNLPLDLMTWIGVPAAVAFLLISGIWGIRRTINVATPVDALCMMLIFALSVHAFLELPHAYVYFLMVCGFAMGLREAPRAVERDLSPSHSKQILVPLALLCLTASLSILIARDYVLLEQDNRVMRWETSPFYRGNLVPYAPSVYLLDQVAAMHQVARTTPSTDMDPETLLRMEQIARLSPYEPAALTKIALAEALNRAPDRMQWHLCLAKKYYKAEESDAMTQWVQAEITRVLGAVPDFFSPHCDKPLNSSVLRHQ